MYLDNTGGKPASPFRQEIAGQQVFILSLEVHDGQAGQPEQLPKESLTSSGQNSVVPYPALSSTSQ